MQKEDFIKILEDMPTTYTSKMRIGENDYALKQLRKTQKNLTMEDIKEHNIEVRGWNEGYKEAVEEYREWRNKIYLQLKNL